MTRLTPEQEFAGWSDSTIIANYARTHDQRCLDELERRQKARGVPLHVVASAAVDAILDAMERGEQN